MTALAAMPHMKMPIWIFWRHLAGLSLYSAPPRAEIAVAKSSHPLSVSFSTGGMSANGMVRPCSCPASVLCWQGAPTTKERAMSQTPKTVGIDIGKNSFHVVGHDERGAIVLRQKWSRGQLEARFANMPPCLVGTEACVGAHHLSRTLKALGHDARLMPSAPIRRGRRTTSAMRRRSLRRCNGRP